MRILIPSTFFLFVFSVSGMDCIHKEQYVNYKWDQDKDFGKVTIDEAISAFHKYPYQEQLEKARTIKQPTFPTVSFECGNNKSNFAVWSLSIGVYEVFYRTNSGKKITIETKKAREIETLMRMYFDGDSDDLESRMSEHEAAVITN